MDFDLELSIQALARTPRALRALLDGLPDLWIRGVEGRDTFSPFDVVGHLIDGEETDWIPRTRIILAEGPNPVFEPYDRFPHRARNSSRTIGSLRVEFAGLRARRSGRAGHGQATPGRGGPLGALPAGAHRPRDAPLLGQLHVCESEGKLAERLWRFQADLEGRGGGDRLEHPHHAVGLDVHR